MKCTPFGLHYLILECILFLIECTALRLIVMTKPKVFLSYARPDRLVVLDIYRYLIEHGCDPWMDTEKLLPGQDWEYEIEVAMEASGVILVCLSSNSVDRTGYAQAELKKALRFFERFPEGKIFLIPVRLDDCKVPRSLNAQNWLDWFDYTARPKLIEVLMGQTPKVTIPPSSLGELLVLSPLELHKALNLYQASVSGSASNKADILAAALTHIMLESFDSARMLLERLRQLDPTISYGWYASAIAELKGRRPWLLNRDEAVLVQSQALKALQIAPSHAHFALFLALIKEDYFVKKGFRVVHPTVLECLNLATKGQTTRGELQILLRFVPVPDGPLVNAIKSMIHA